MAVTSLAQVCAVNLIFPHPHTQTWHRDLILWVENYVCNHIQHKQWHMSYFR